MQKPPRVMAVRGLQEVQFALLDTTGGWARIDRAARKRWTAERAERLARAKPFAIFAPDGAAAFRSAIAAGTLEAGALRRAAEDVTSRRFTIFGTQIPQEGPWPWRVDWRFAHDWPLAPWQKFSHAEKRDLPYDVKFPWELGRLQFLIPLLQGALLEPQRGYADQALRILEDWCADNPYARSVNWNPMETSMRTIALGFCLELLRAAGAPGAQQARLLSEIERNAEFVWRTIEDTDIRGNHYTANLAALMVAGAALAPELPRARRWLDYAARRMDSEVALQFLADGVNMEKSIYYHRLVTDLFLLIYAVGTRQGLTFSPATRDRLHRACRFAMQYTRPDGHAPVIGDSDDARVFAMDDVPVHDHRATLALGAVLFDDGELGAASGGALPSTLWLTGCAPRITARDTHCEFFADGGFAIAGDGKAHLIADVGEVGLKGRGGHGHNDILGFELSLGGVAAIVDCGSYIYTGDLAARNRFRATRAHNGLVLDGQEIATLGPEPFRISPAAVPLAASMVCENGTWIIAGGHEGYKNLRDPARHLRIFRFNPAQERLEIEDRIESNGSHQVERFLHFAPAASVTIDGLSARATIGSLHLRISWGAETSGHIDEGEVSCIYGHKTPAPILRLASRSVANTVFTLTIERDTGGN